MQVMLADLSLIPVAILQAVLARRLNLSVRMMTVKALQA